MKTVLYIGNFSFPNGNAAGKRVFANGKLLKELGYEVIFIGMSKSIDFQSSLIETKNTYDGFTFYNFTYPKKNLDWLNYNKIYKELLNLIYTEQLIHKLELIIYYGSPTLSLFITKLIKFCHKNKIKIVADCVDWLTVKTNNLLFNIIKWVDNTYQKAYANKKCDGVIAISSYLFDYYKRSGCKTIIIPPLSPIEYKINDYEIHDKDKIIVTYAGQPFRKNQRVYDKSTLKDRIDKTIILFHTLKKKGCNFEFNIYGFTKNEYLSAIPEQSSYIEDLGDSIKFYGYLPNEEVINNIINSDFTMLIRDINRDTTAGFPTKISESISCGTPVITTKTSDIAKYIENGKNGFLLDVDNEQNYAIKVAEILKKDRSEIKKMKEYCRNNYYFNYKSYISEFKNFIQSLY